MTATRDAIELAGGLDVIKGGDKVCIKPNLTTASAVTTTNPQVLRAVIQAVAAHTDPANITVGECTAFGGNTRSVANTLKIIDLCKDEGANFLAFDEGKYNLFRHESWTHIGDKKRVPECLNPMSFEHFISVPKLKNHEMSGGDQEYTCCMKLFVGLIPFTGQGSRENERIHTTDLGEKVAELGWIVPNVTMNVVDAIQVMLTQGPTGPGVREKANLVLASTDRVACDSVAVAVLKTYAKIAGKSRVNKAYVNKSVWKQAQIKHAIKIGLGAQNIDNIKLVQKGVDNFNDIKSNWV
jgi:uncharacterized protein (DUF362 family)